MWYDVLTKTKLGRVFLEYRSMLIFPPLDYVDFEKHEDIDKSSGSDKPESYIWVKREGVLHKPKYSQLEMKYNTHFLQSSQQECV